MEKYLVPDYNDVLEFLSHLGKRLGKLKKGKTCKQDDIVMWNKVLRGVHHLAFVFHRLKMETIVLVLKVSPSRFHSLLLLYTPIFLGQLCPRGKAETGL